MPGPQFMVGAHTHTHMQTLKRGAGGTAIDCICIYMRPPPPLHGCSATCARTSALGPCCYCHCRAVQVHRVLAPDGLYLLASCRDPQVRLYLLASCRDLWQGPSGEGMHTLPCHTHAARHMYLTLTLHSIPSCPAVLVSCFTQECARPVN